MNSSDFNDDELLAQHLAGGGPLGTGIRDAMPDQHRKFFAGLRYLTVASVDAAGWPVATMLAGDPGFVHAPDPTTLRIGLASDSADPALRAFVPGRDIGVLGLDLATRRRNRANGLLTGRDAQTLTVGVEQSFGNCPQYIQRRAVEPAARTAGRVENLATLDTSAKDLIASADTLFVASRSRQGQGWIGGADISHRGGRPGFVRLDGDTLEIPDFHGNRYFNTLGNLLGEPRAALLFLDFEHGDLLHLQGDAHIDWSGEAVRQFEGAERSWRLRIVRAWRRRGAVPLRWTFIDQAPTTGQTGTRARAA